MPATTLLERATGRHLSLPEHLAQVVEAGLVDPPDHLDRLRLGGARRLERARPFDLAALPVLVLLDMERRLVGRHRQRARDDRVGVRPLLVVLALESLDDAAA